MKAIISSELNIPAAAAWHLAKQSKTLSYVCKGLLSFDDSKAFPSEWHESKTIHTRLRLFGLIPAWKHSIKFEKINETGMRIFTLEKGGLIKRWDH